MLLPRPLFLRQLGPLLKGSFLDNLMSIGQVVADLDLQQLALHFLGELTAPESLALKIKHGRVAMKDATRLS